MIVATAPAKVFFVLTEYDFECPEVAQMADVMADVLAEAWLT